MLNFKETFIPAKNNARRNAFKTLSCYTTLDWFTILISSLEI